MTPNYLAITEGAAEFLASSASNLNNPPFTNTSSDALNYKIEGDSGLIWSNRDQTNVRYAVIVSSEIDSFPVDTDPKEVFARVLRTLRAAGKFPFRLPLSWAEYHHKSLISFFALSRNAADPIRWIVEVDEGRKALNFVKLTSPEKTQELEKFHSPNIPDLRAAIDAAVEQKSETVIEKPTSIIDRVDFETIGSAAIGKARTFEDWLKLLHPKQQEVLDLPQGSSVRIVGPAGSGKTLTLCLKAIRETLRAKESGRPPRILFATHSWAMAERIDDTLISLNGGQAVKSVTVYPLLQILNEVVGGSMLKGVRLLGGDSSEGRRLQLAHLSDAVESISSIDKAVLASQELSPTIRSALNGNETDKAELIENLYEEINGVLLADGLIPGDRRKEEDYLSRVRSDDLPPFPTRGDRGLVLIVYKDFLTRLREQEYVTTDQLVSDATRVLETFAWGVKRESEGFDLIFIDELQLFDAQERFALALLASSQESTAFITAEDPSQGLFSAISPIWNKDVPTRNDRKSIELNASVRFSPSILALIYRLYQAFPLNAQALNIEEVHAQEGKPVLIRKPTASSAEEAVCLMARDIVPRLDSASRLAIISLDGSAHDIAKQLRTHGIANVVEILGLEDIEKLGYARRSVVVGEWQFLGGTQFSHVIVAAPHGTRAKSAFSRVRELTSLYVAASRAAQWLCFVIGENILTPLQDSVDSGLIQDGGEIKLS